MPKAAWLTIRDPQVPDEPQKATNPHIPNSQEGKKSWILRTPIQRTELLYV